MDNGKSLKRDIILIQPYCGKYDLFIRDMPLGLLYISRLLTADYNVHIIDQRVLQDKTYDVLSGLLKQNPLWVGITTMTGEPVHHALQICAWIRAHSKVPLVWGGIHPTILTEVTLQHQLVDFVLKGKAERSVLQFSRYLLADCDAKDVTGLAWFDEEGLFQDNPEDNDSEWGEMPMVPYDLIDIDDYARVGFEPRVFPIMTSRNCPHKCTFCYNSALKSKFTWFPDSVDYTERHIDYILEKYNPTYLSFIDDDFFVDRERARKILQYVEKVKPKHVKCGFRGVRISDLRLLDDSLFDLLIRINTVHLNIGIESGSDRILKKLKKGMKAQDAININRRFLKYPQIIPLYNFFAGIPGETNDDIKKSTDLILQLTRENPRCQISGFHQYTPYPGNSLYDEAVEAGFPVPRSLQDWGDQRFEENAKNCPWVSKDQKALLEMVYCMIYFVDSKYDMYFSNNNWMLKALKPFVSLYKHIARFRMKHHVTAFPIEVWAKDVIYKIYYKPLHSIAPDQAEKLDNTQPLKEQTSIGGS